MQLSTSASFSESSPPGDLIAGVPPLSAMSAPDTAAVPVASFADLMAPFPLAADPSAPAASAPPVPVSPFLLPGEVSSPAPFMAMLGPPSGEPLADLFGEAPAKSTDGLDAPAEPGVQPAARMRASNPSANTPDRLALEAAAALYMPIMPVEPLSDVSLIPLPMAPVITRANPPGPLVAATADPTPLAADAALPAGSPADSMPTRVAADHAEPPRNFVGSEKPAASPVLPDPLKTENDPAMPAAPAGSPPDANAARVGANFAELPRNLATAGKPAASPTFINFLNIGNDRDTDAAMNFGTDVAKSSEVMSRASTHRFTPDFDPASPLAPAIAAPAFAAQSIAQPQAVRAPSPGETLAAAHRAVDAVMAAADRFTPASPSVVNLRLEVGDQDLGVRVELRGGAVHATFRTDSPELRAALNHEWRAAVAQPQDPSLRLAAPVFAAGDRPGDDARPAFSGEHPGHARDHAARQTPEFILPGGVRGRTGSPAGPADAAAAPASARNAPAGSVRLHAFA